MSLAFLYNIFDWYWVVADTGPTTLVFSSKTGTSVANTAAAYVTWVGTTGSGALSVLGAANNGSGLIRLTTDPGNFVTNDRWVVTGVGGTTEANGTWPVTVVDSTHVDLQGSTFTHTFTSGGVIGRGTSIDTLNNLYSLLNTFNSVNWEQNSVFAGFVALGASPSSLTNTMARSYEVRTGAASGQILKLPAANVPGAPPIGAPILFWTSASATQVNWELQKSDGTHLTTVFAFDKVFVWPLNNTEANGPWKAARIPTVSIPVADAQLLTSQTTFADDGGWFKVSVTGDVTLDDTGVMTITKPMRELLTADRTYYVRTDGSDSNTGLVNSAGGAFLTIQKAMNVVAGAIDFGGKNVTIQVVAGTYTAGVNINPWMGGGTLTFLGDNTTPANVVIAVASGGIATGSCFIIQNGALPGPVTIKGFKLTTTGTGLYCIAALSACNITPGNLEFGACVASHIFMGTGGYYNLINSYTISGGANRHLQSNAGGIIFPTGNVGGTITISAAVTINVYAFAQETGVVQHSSLETYVNIGNVTGQTYNVSLNGVINSAGVVFPGTVAGAFATGGQYV